MKIAVCRGVEAPLTTVQCCMVAEGGIAQVQANAQEVLDVIIILQRELIPKAYDEHLRPLFHETICQSRARDSHKCREPA